MVKKITKTARNKEQKTPPDMSSAVIKVENPKNVHNLYTSEFSGMNPTKLKIYLMTAMKGLFYFKSLFFEEIRRRDLKIGGDCQTRKLSVANKEWELKYSKESSVPEETQKNIRSFVLENLKSCKLVNFMTDCVEAQIQGVSFFENIFKPEGSYVFIDSVNYIPNHLLCFDDLKNEYRHLLPQKIDTNILRTLGWNSLDQRIKLDGLAADPLDPFKKIEVHSLDGNAQNGIMNGCIDSLIWAFLFKNYGLKDWSIYVERFAIPSIVAKFPPIMSKADKRLLEEAVQNFGHLFRAVIPDGATLDFTGDNDKANSQKVFESYTHYWDNAISIRLLGQTLTSEMGKNGSFAAAQVHNEVRRDLMVTDMLLVKEAVNELVKKVIILNFGKQIEYPEFSFEEEEDIDYKLKRSEIARNLMLAGYRVIQEDIEEEFDWRVEKANTPGAAPDANPGSTEDPENNYIKNFIEDYWNGLHR